VKEMLKINKYKTEIDSFYMFVSHQKNGRANVSYGLVRYDRKIMVVIEPHCGPLTILESDKDVIDDYLSHKCDHTNWRQKEFDENKFDEIISEGNFQKATDILKRFL
jgi:hypothetical protein